jgi:hypothetical protein
MMHFAQKRCLPVIGFPQILRITGNFGFGPQEVKDVCNLQHGIELLNSTGQTIASSQPAVNLAPE